MAKSPCCFINEQPSGKKVIALDKNDAQILDILPPDQINTLLRAVFTATLGVFGFRHGSNR